LKINLLFPKLMIPIQLRCSISRITTDSDPLLQHFDLEMLYCTVGTRICVHFVKEDSEANIVVVSLCSQVFDFCFFRKLAIIFHILQKKSLRIVSHTDPDFIDRIRFWFLFWIRFALKKKLHVSLHFLLPWMIFCPCLVAEKRKHTHSKGHHDPDPKYWYSVQ
jgi:hypothetical protein